MYPHQTIYNAKRSKISGEFRLSPRLIARLGYHLLRGFGAGVVSFAIIGLIFAFWPIVSSEFTYRFGSKEKVANGDAIAISKFASIIDRSQAEELGLDDYFSIYIPKIDARAKVIPNVDAGSPKSYLEALEDGVAHASGTNFPGVEKQFIYFPILQIRQ